jgi:hypothetical protein
MLISQIPAIGQIGIGTNNPEGLLDISMTQGFVYPRVTLVNTTTATITTPDGNPPVIGTMVYNTKNSGSDASAVYPGLYQWNGTQWVAQFDKKDNKIYIQNRNLGTGHSVGQQGVSFDSKTFVPQYYGTYKIKVSLHFGAGKIEDFTTGDDSYISLATSEGAFFFKLEGNGRIMIDPEASSYDYVQGWSYTHAYSAESDNEATAIESYNVPHFATLVYYKPLIAGTPYTFNLRHKAVTGAAVFQNRGASGEGMGHIGHDVPCSVEFEFLGN